MKEFIYKDQKLELLNQKIRKKLEQKKRVTFLQKAKKLLFFLAK